MMPDHAPGMGGRQQGYDGRVAINPGDIDTVVLDIDGTLVDSNYHHTIAWGRAFRRLGHVVPHWRIHRCIGMGGDRLVPSLVGDEVDRELGDEMRDTWASEVQRILYEIEPLECAPELLEELDRRPVKVVLASSGYLLSRREPTPAPATMEA